MLQQVICFPVGPRIEDVAALQRIIPECVAEAAVQIGPDGVKAFFDGYKEVVDLEKKAA